MASGIPTVGVGEPQSRTEVLSIGQPSLLTQNAASFFNRVSPANAGGMALNVRYLQRPGVDTGVGAAALGVSSAAGVPLSTSSSS
jgi:hypothetical protein